MVARAGAFGLSGWVRNRQDGAVEAVVAGPAATVEAMLAVCRVGPPAADVSRVLVTDTDWPDGSGFIWTS